MATTVTIGGEGTMFVGEDKTLRLELLNGPASDSASIPVDMSAMSLLFDVRLKDNSPDPAIISKIPSLTGIYNAVRATNTQRAIVLLDDNDLNLVKAKTYRHSWKRTDELSETVLCRGDFAPEKATAP